MHDPTLTMVERYPTLRLACSGPQEEKVRALRRGKSDQHSIAALNDIRKVNEDIEQDKLSIVEFDLLACSFPCYKNTQLRDENGGNYHPSGDLSAISNRDSDGSHLRVQAPSDHLTCARTVVCPAFRKD
jgi:hypothetical protein